MNVRLEPWEEGDPTGDAFVYVGDRRGAVWFNHGYWWARMDGESEATRHGSRDDGIAALREGR